MPRSFPPRADRPALLALTAAATAASAVASWLALSTPAAAVSTRSFRLDDADSLREGTLSGAAVSSDGSVVPGVETRRVALPDAAVAWSVARGPGDVVFVGTGNEGEVLRVDGDAVETFAETGQLVVSSLARGPDGVLWAGTLPEGRVFEIAADGEARELVNLDGAEHVWDLVWDARRRTLFAATGPEGKVFAIDAGGNASVWWDAESGHVMSLDLDGEALYAGTDGEALVLRIEGPGRAQVVWDFPGNEVTALDARDGAVAVAANEMPDPPPAPSGRANARTRPNRPGTGKGRLWRVGADGRAEKLFARDDGHFTDVVLGADGVIFVAVGKDGRVERVDAERRSATWIDVDERQVLALDFPDDGEPVLVTGDAGALYRVRDARPAQATWTSGVLDAGFVARFGELRWWGDGELRFETRSGNVSEPDATWSDWSAAVQRPGPVRSPAARYVQARATLGRGAVLRAVELFYLPRNQRAIVGEVGLDTKAMAKRRRGRPDDAPPEPSAVVPLEWDVENPDGDALRYRLRYRPADGRGPWRDVLRESEELSDDEYAWDTGGLPDGRYVVEVEATDAPSNPPALALSDVAVSEPLLVDNHPPRVIDLRLQGLRLTGRAVDELGPIARLEVAIDGGEWRLLFPVDDLLDTAEERFSVDLSAEPTGEHVVAIRATDAGGNAATAERVVTLRRGG